MIKLRECPFCGKSVARFTTVAETESCVYFESCYEPTCTMKAVVCSVNEGGCGASTGYHESEEDARRAWNRREE